MGFFSGFRGYAKSPEAVFDSLRTDLQDCIDDIDPHDANQVLSSYIVWGASLAGVPASESFLAVSPTVVRGGSGLLALTSKRLLFSGQFGRVEVPAQRLSMAGLTVTPLGTVLRVAVAPTNHPVYVFEFSTVQDATRRRFLSILETFVRDAEDAANGHVQRSAADELAKFARLRDQGVITEGEFAAKKAQLLSE